MLTLHARAGLPRRTAAALAWLALAAVAAPASADDLPESSSALAAAHKKEGDEAFRQLRYADALRSYDSAYAFGSDPALHYNRGRALEALERYAEAVEALEAFGRDAPAALRARTPGLADHVRKLKQRVATVRFVVSPPRARILLRQVVVGVAPLAGPIRMSAGPARVEIEADGYAPYAEDLHLVGASETTVTVELTRKPTTRLAVAPLGGSPADAERSGDSILSRWWFWAAAGAVVAGAGAGLFVLTRAPEPREGDVGQLTAPLHRF